MATDLNSTTEAQRRRVNFFLLHLKQEYRNNKMLEKYNYISDSNLKNY